MEYSPGCALPVVSSVDAGTIELVRGMGVEVVSSADLIQFAVARWSPGALREHERVSRITDAIMQQAFAFVRDALAGGRTATELDVQRLILRRFEEEQLETASPPIVAVNEHSGDPHYEVSQTDPRPVRAGDWLYVDLWAKAPGDANVFSDITWCAFAGKQVPTKHREVFEVVRAARDAALRKAQEGWKSGGVAGWQLDEAARAVIIEAGFERAIKHRTGHSLSPGPRVHGMGMNLDNLETRDTRRMLAGLGFTIEPGVYLPEFGARSEINVYVDAQRGPVVTSGLQRDVVMLG
jgi:Xaa-Pro aminopeptidase